MLDDMPQSNGVDVDSSPAALFVSSEAEARRAVEERLSSSGYLKPVVSFVSQWGDDADCHDREQVAKTIERFEQRRCAVGEWLVESTNPEHRLLAYLYVSEKPLRARYIPREKQVVGYGHFLPVMNPAKVAAVMERTGLLHKTFFDRIHVCDRCGSSRVTIREECMVCRSSHLQSSPLLHHFRCAHQGLERDFRRDDDRLICPKCSRELRHYGSDHEQSGTIIECASCGNTEQEALVGFVCLDCAAHFDSKSMRTVDWFNYELTDTGRALAENLYSTRDQHILTVLRQTCPLSIVRRIRELHSGQNDTPQFVLGEISYKHEKSIVGEWGFEAFERAREHLLAQLRGTLREDCLVVRGAAYDYTLIPHIDKEWSQNVVSKALTASSRHLAVDVGAQADLYDARDILG
jgi:hypothetical protein